MDQRTVYPYLCGLFPLVYAGSNPTDHKWQGLYFRNHLRIPSASPCPHEPTNCHDLSIHCNEG